MGMLPDKTDGFYGPSEFRAIDIADRNNPQSLYNRVPQMVKDRITDAYVRKYMELPEDELEAKLPKNLIAIKRIRISLWREYEKCLLPHGHYNQVMITVRDLIGGICTYDFFVNQLLMNPIVCAYILSPPVNYTVAMEEALEHGINKMREIMNFPIMKLRSNPKTGGIQTDPETGEYLYEPDYKTAELILKTVTLLDQRVKGALTQNINIKQKQQVSVNVSRGTQRAPAIHVNASDVHNKISILDDLDERINALQRDANRMINQTEYDEQEEAIISKRSDAILAEKLEGIRG